MNRRLFPWNVWLKNEQAQEREVTNRAGAYSLIFSLGSWLNEISKN